jgi:hypothetical protein
MPGILIISFKPANPVFLIPFLLTIGTPGIVCVVVLSV